MDQIRQAGVVEGDTICMGNLEFELVDQYILKGENYDNKTTTH